MLCLCLRVCAHARVSDLLKHEGKLHAVFGNILCVQKTVELKVDPPAGAVLVGAGRQSEGERGDYKRVAKATKARVPHGTHTQEYCSLLELGEHICDHSAALNGFLRTVVVFEQGKHVRAVLHGQTSDQLLHHLTNTHTRLC